MTRVAMHQQRRGPEVKKRVKKERDPIARAIDEAIEYAMASCPSARWRQQKRPPATNSERK